MADVITIYPRTANVSAQPVTVIHHDELVRMSASEQLFFVHAHVAHVVAYEQELLERARRRRAQRAWACR